MITLLLVIAIILTINWVFSYIDSLKEKFNTLLEKSKREAEASKTRELILRTVRESGS